jgi:hypothetical protein
METKHTPGPWGNKAINGGWDAVFSEKTNSIICEIKENNAQNIKLIAAAPELLEALTSLMLEAEKRGGVPKQYIANARAAIAKATGACEE